MRKISQLLLILALICGNISHPVLASSTETRESEDIINEQTDNNNSDTQDDAEIQDSLNMVQDDEEPSYREEIDNDSEPLPVNNEEKASVGNTSIDNEYADPIEPSEELEEDADATVGITEHAVVLENEGQSLASTVSSGTCGNEAEWTLSNGTLEISGSGTIDNYSGNSQPWNSYKTEITKVVVNDGITSIGNYAFQGLVNLTDVELPETLKTIGKYTFSGCSSIGELILPDSITGIQEFAFEYCNGLKQIHLPSSLYGLKRYVFKSCTSLTELTLSANLTSFGYSVFSDCSNLKTIYFTGNAPSFIQPYAFSGLSNATLYYPQNEQDDVWNELIKKNYGGGIRWTQGSYAVSEEAPEINKKKVAVFNGHTYEVVDEGQGQYWGNAKAACEKKGGHLLTITSQEEQDFVKSIIANHRKYIYWIGLNYKSWVTGEAFDFTNNFYYEGQPYGFIHGYTGIISNSYVDYDISLGSWGDHDDYYRNDPWDYTNMGYICEYDYLNNDLLFNGELCSELPKMSSEDAITFLCFLYNKQDYSAIDQSKDTYYKLLTGDYSDYETADDLEMAIGMFEEFVITAMNVQLGDSNYRIEKSSAALLKQLQKELDGLSTLDNEIVNEKTAKVKKQLENGLLEVECNLAQQFAGVIVTDNNIEDIKTIIQTKDTIMSAPKKAKLIVDRIHAAMEGVVYILNQEIKGRTEYFSCYLNNRMNYDSPDDSTFQSIMDYNYVAIKESSLGPKILGYFTWVFGKDDWTNHRDKLDYWAEFIYILCNTPVTHDFVYTTTAPSCEEEGIKTGECKNCGKIVTEEIASIGHVSHNIIHPASCVEDGYIEKKCDICGLVLESEIYEEAFGHSWDLGEIIKEPTTSENGIIRYTCVDCMESREEAIDTLPDQFVPVEGIKIEENEVTLSENTKKKMVVTVIPENASDKSISWFSSNPYVAHVVENEIVAKMPGQSTIICQTKNGQYSATIQVTVKKENDEIATVIGHSLSLTGNIGVNYYVELNNELLDDAEAKMVFKIGDSIIKEIPVSEGKDKTVKGVECKRFTCEVNSTQMTNEIIGQIITSEDESNEFPFSVKQYADIIIENSDNNPDYDKALPLVKAMLNYGGYAQKFFKYDDSPLANEDLSEKEKEVSSITVKQLEEYAPSIEGTQEGLSYYGSSLLLKSETTIRHYFTLNDGYNIDDYKFKCGEKLLPYYKKGGYYYVEISDIPSGELDTGYIVTTGDFSIRYSALSYAYNTISLENSSSLISDLLKALYLYNQAANTYFNR